jgi:hypothetical protein
MMMQIAMAASPLLSEPPIPPEPVPPPEPLFPPTEPPIPPPWPPHPPPAPEPPVLAAPPWRSPLAGRSGTPDPSLRGVAVDRFRIDIWLVSRSPSACRTTGSPHRHRFSLMAIRANTYGWLMCLMSNARCCLQPGPVDLIARRRWGAFFAHAATAQDNGTHWCCAGHYGPDAWTRAAPRSRCVGRMPWSWLMPALQLTSLGTNPGGDDEALVTYSKT